MGKELKTNAMRILEKNQVSYEMYQYESDGFLDGVTVATKLSLPLDRTFKTLLAQGKSKEYLVYVIPVNEELDLKNAAKAAGEKSVELIPVKDITAVSGYVRGGCSPIGMKKRYRTFVHCSASNAGDIIVSGGRLGTQIRLSVTDLVTIIGAKLADITFHEK
ncbi:MAG: Cys-tRNA(Pro)/Cys-tRNA(Cys) deacylase [Clostridiales bacterium]|nr:Cys-tRNA(Pro)/Cys-tRNA(Cys) deacylase [Clostridiales bacterium]